MDYTTRIETSFYVGLETASNLEIAPVEVIDLITEYVEGGTFYEAKGLWKGSTENSLVFEVVDIRDSMTADFRDELDESNISDPVEYLKDVLVTEFNQESVMVKRSDAEVSF